MNNSFFGDKMAVSEQCKTEVLEYARRRVAKKPLRKKIGKSMIDSGIGRIQENEWSMNIVDFIIQNYSNLIKELNAAPECIKQYSVKDVVDAYNELKDQI